MSRVMVVDDDRDIRVLIDVVLRTKDIDVVPMADGHGALELLRAGERVDLVILDVQMPSFDGWTTLSELRGDPSIASLPVLLCTVRGTAEDILRGWEAGCDGYVAKPFYPVDLLHDVHRVLALDPPLREAERMANVDLLRRQLAAEP